MSNQRERADLFVKYLGLELKGRIAATQGFHATGVAKIMGRSPGAFTNWLNGKAGLPPAVLCEACEVIGVDPRDVVDRAYRRMVAELGPAIQKVREPQLRVVTDAIELKSRVKRRPPS